MRWRFLDRPEFLGPEGWAEREAESKACGAIYRALGSMSLSRFDRPNLASFVPLIGRPVKVIWLGEYTILGQLVTVYVGSDRKLYRAAGNKQRLRFKRLFIEFRQREELESIVQFLRDMPR